MVVVRAMKMAPWVVVALLAEASELIVVLLELAEVVAAALEQMPVADVAA